MKRRVLAVTSSRSDYGLLRHTLRAIQIHNQLELQLLVTGSHLSERFGLTVREIEADGAIVDFTVDLELDQRGDSSLDIARIFASATVGVAEVIQKSRPDILLVLGDRYEILAACTAALLASTPVAHIHGGELTVGAFDDSIRHAITKIASLHFPVHPAYAARIRQLGEHPNSVILIDPPVTEVLMQLAPKSRSELERRLGIRLTDPIVVVSYHPVTQAQDVSILDLEATLRALESLSNVTYVVTGTNADPMNQLHDKLLRDFVARSPESRAFAKSLGHDTYLSLLKIAAMVVGNSSSGVIEAPLIGTPSLNIGMRQLGRVHPTTVTSVVGDEREISRAIKMILDNPSKREPAIGKQPASQLISQTLATCELGRPKVFNDV